MKTGGGHDIGGIGDRGIFINGVEGAEIEIIDTRSRRFCNSVLTESAIGDKSECMVLLLNYG